MAQSSNLILSCFPALVLHLDGLATGRTAPFRKSPETDLEEINSDLPEADFWPPRFRFQYRNLAVANSGRLVVGYSQH
jgi:hypothetical protein